VVPVGLRVTTPVPFPVGDVKLADEPDTLARGVVLNVIVFNAVRLDRPLRPSRNRRCHPAML
jgi:hypothetical protein